MEKQKYISKVIKIFIVAMFLLPVFLLGFSMKKEGNTYATSSVDFEYATCLDFDGNEVEYDTNSTVYAREITLFYDTNSPQYIIIVYNKASNEIGRTQLKEPDENGKGSYTVETNGELTIRCYGADENGFIFDNVYVDTYVRSDNLSPKEPFVSQMTNWTKHLNGYSIDVLVGEDNGNAGINKAEVSIIYDEETVYRTITSPIMNDYFIVYEECSVVINIFDNAGNNASFSYVFDKFDSTPPTPPTFNLVPNIEVGEATNGYARDYQITINYGEDTASGIDNTSMVYTLNGEQFPYEGGFTLTEQRNFEISAYYKDNAGNTSETITTTINNIDRIEPSISNIQLAVDLMKNIPYKLSMICSDAESGINRIVVPNINTTFVRGMYNVYVGEFATLDKAVLSITVYDNVGNFETTSILTHHFGNLDLEDLAIEYNQKFLNLESEEYAERAWSKILDLYSNLNLMFMSKDTTLNDFDTISKDINKAILGATEYKYVINTIPQFISTSISYQINPLDLNNKKKGDRISMILDALEENAQTEDKIAIANTLSGYEKSMARPFKLSFTHNDESIDYVFTNGTKITMAVPKGYEERYFTIINLDSKVIIESEKINNTIIFYINDGGEYALVIEGTAKLLEVEPPKGLHIFGKTISWWSFSLALGGILIGAISLIAFLRYRLKPKMHIDTK